MTNSAAAPVPASVLEALARYDTPTICNAMEVIAPERRLIGYTVKPLVCPFPDLPPMVGYARTVTIRSVIKSGLPAAEQAKRRIEAGQRGAAIGGGELLVGQHFVERDQSLGRVEIVGQGCVEAIKIKLRFRAHVAAQFLSRHHEPLEPGERCADRLAAEFEFGPVMRGQA